MKSLVGFIIIALIGYFVISGLLDESHTCDLVETDRREATCTDVGFIEYKCADCGKTTKETLYAEGHSVVVIFEGYEATCFSNGATSETMCSKCHQTLEKSTVITSKHTDSNGDHFLISRMINILINSAGFQ